MLSQWRMDGIPGLEWRRTESPTPPTPNLLKTISFDFPTNPASLWIIKSATQFLPSSLVSHFNLSLLEDFHNVHSLSLSISRNRPAKISINRLRAYRTPISESCGFLCRNLSTDGPGSAVQLAKCHPRFWWMYHWTRRSQSMGGSQFKGTDDVALLFGYSLSFSFRPSSVYWTDLFSNFNWFHLFFWVDKTRNIPWMGAIWSMQGNVMGWVFGEE